MKKHLQYRCGRFGHRDADDGWQYRSTPQFTPTPPSTSSLTRRRARNRNSTQPTDPTAQQPSTPTQAQPSQTPDQGGQATPNTPSQPSATATDSQTFSGTIVKTGDKYVLEMPPRASRTTLTTRIR